jgi:hypothetical protein
MPMVLWFTRQAVPAELPKRQAPDCASLGTNEMHYWLLPIVTEGAARALLPEAHSAIESRNRKQQKGGDIPTAYWPEGPRASRTIQT